MPDPKFDTADFWYKRGTKKCISSRHIYLGHVPQRKGSFYPQMSGDRHLSRTWKRSGSWAWRWQIRQGLEVFALKIKWPAVSQSVSGNVCRGRICHCTSASAGDSCVLQYRSGMHWSSLLLLDVCRGTLDFQNDSNVKENVSEGLHHRGRAFA